MNPLPSNVKDWCSQTKPPWLSGRDMEVTNLSSFWHQDCISTYLATNWQQFIKKHFAICHKHFHWYQLCAHDSLYNFTQTQWTEKKVDIWHWTDWLLARMGRTKDSSSAWHLLSHVRSEDMSWYCDMITATYKCIFWAIPLYNIICTRNF